MLKVLIAEDEFPTRRKIASLVMKDGGYTVINIAGDGLKAQNAIKENKPDILITDIQMPVINGIELISWVRSSGYDIEIIVISGYDDFEYARKSLEYNVRLYLLKPIDEKELSGAMSLCTELHAKKKREQGNKILSTNLFGAGAIMGDTTPQCYALCIVCAGSLPFSIGTDMSPEYNFLKLLNFDMIFGRKASSSPIVWHTTGFTSHEEVVLVTFGMPDDIDAVMRSGFEELRGRRLPVTVVYSGAYRQLSDIAAVHSMLRKKLKAAARFSFSGFCRATDNIPDKEIPLDIETLIFKFRHGNFDSFYDAFKAEADKWRKREITSHSLCHMLMHIFDRLSEDIDKSMRPVPEYLHEAIADVLTASCDYEAMIGGIKNIAREVFCLKNHEETHIPSTHEVIENVRQYISDHMCNQITVQSIAVSFGFTPSYLSQLFIKYFKTTPTMYLIELRMRKAEELLKQEPELTVKQVSAMVGYDDQFYFSKRFKKMTGCSPSEYRDMLTEKK
jgi:two-component system, response regulator YesN